ncbi:MAG TPA: O-antigen ligase family protein [Oscillatoriaceae cyanobacterium]
MTKLALFGFLGAMAIAWLVVSARRPRDGLITLLTFSMFSLDALPWQLIPLKGAALGLQAGAMGLAGLYWLTRRKQNGRLIATPYALALVAFWLVLLVYSVIPAPSMYGLEKSALFLFKVLLPVGAFALLAPFERRDARLMVATLIVAGMLMALNIMAFSNLNLDRAILRDDVGPIALARVLGEGMTVALALAIGFSGSRWLERLLCLAVMPLMGFALMLSGTRGPVVALAVAAVGGFLCVHDGWARKLKALACVALVAGVGVAALQLSPVDLDQYAGFKRLQEHLADIGNNRSDYGRIQREEIALASIQDSQALGIGTGGFSALCNEDGREYPHNCVLEVATEQGVVGLLPLLLIFALALGRLMVVSRRMRDDPYTKALFCIWFYWLCNAMVSSDLPGNAGLWIIGALPWMFTPAPAEAAAQAIPVTN